MDTWHNEYVLAGCPAKNMQHFKNVVNSCLFEEEDRSKLVLEVVPLPELHMLMGFVNHMSKFIISVWPEFEAWVMTLGCIRRGYHGGTYEGNTCRIILLNCDKLENLLPLTLIPLLDPMRKFNKVVHGTFGHTLDEQWESLIIDFTASFEKAQQYCSQVIKRRLCKQCLIYSIKIFLEIRLSHYLNILFKFLEKELTTTWKIHTVTAHLS